MFMVFSQTATRRFLWYIWAQRFPQAALMDIVYRRVLINNSRCVPLCFLLCLCLQLIYRCSLHIQLVDLFVKHTNRHAMPYKVMRKQALDALYNAN